MGCLVSCGCSGGVDSECRITKKRNEKKGEGREWFLREHSSREPFREA